MAMTEAEKRGDKVKMFTFPLVMAGLYAGLMSFEWEGRAAGLGALKFFFEWLLVDTLGFWGSVALVAGIFYFISGLLLLGNDPHAERC